MAKTKERKPWIFTKKRRASLVKARQEHSKLVELGRKARKNRN